MRTHRFVPALALAAFLQGAFAADITFHLEGRIADVLPAGIPPWVGGYAPLTDADTANGQLPAMTWSVGDNLTAVVSFDHALDVPASRPGLAVPYAMSFTVSLQKFDDTANPLGATLYYTADWHFYEHGVEVGPGFAPQPQEYGCGGGGFCLSPSWAGQTAAFSFDSFTATGHITAILDSTNTSVPSIAVVEAPAQLIYGVAAVPEPASALMALSGLALLGWRSRRVLKR